MCVCKLVYTGNQKFLVGLPMDQLGVGGVLGFRACTMELGRGPNIVFCLQNNTRETKKLLQ